MCTTVLSIQDPAFQSCRRFLFCKSNVTQESVYLPDCTCALSEYELRQGSSCLNDTNSLRIIACCDQCISRFLSLLSPDALGLLVPQWRSDGSHSNAYWQGKSAKAIANNRYIWIQSHHGYENYEHACYVAVLCIALSSEGAACEYVAAFCYSSSQWLPFAIVLHAMLLFFCRLCGHDVQTSVIGVSIVNCVRTAQSVC